MHVGRQCIYVHKNSRNLEIREILNSEIMYICRQICMSCMYILMYAYVYVGREV